MASQSQAGFLGKLHDVHQTFFGAVTRVLGGDVLRVLARLALAGVFWRSMLTKVEVTKLFPYTEYINDFAVEKHHVRVPALPFEMKASTYEMFRTEFALPLVPPELAAWMALLGEFFLPVLLVLGLATRFAAFGLLVMTAVIQIFVYPEAWWGTHALWAVMAIFLAANGPGRLSVDHLARGFFAR